MSKNNKLTLRLNDERNDKLEQLQEQRDVEFKADVLRQLIDEANPSSQTLSKVQDDIKQIKAAVGVSDDSESGLSPPTSDAGDSTDTPDATLPDTPAQLAATGDTAMITTDDGTSVPVSELTPAHVESNDIAIPPNDYSDKAPESVSKTTGLLISVLNWLESHRDRDGMTIDELDRTIEMVTGRGGDTVKEYRDRLINQGYAYVSPLVDPMFDNRWDDLLVKIYGGSEYKKREARGALADDPADLLGGWWLDKVADAQVYLSESAYEEYADRLLYEIEEKMAVRWASASRREDREQAWSAWRRVYVTLVGIVSARTYGEIDSSRSENYLDILMTGDIKTDEGWNDWFADSHFIEISDIEPKKGLN